MTDFRTLPVLVGARPLLLRFEANGGSVEACLADWLDWWLGAHNGTTCYRRVGAR